MSWIDEELKSKNRRLELCGHATELRNAVWREILARVEEARGKVPGAAHLAVISVRADADEVRFPQVAGGPAPKTLTVKVSNDGCSIESSNHKKFPLGYNGDSPSLMQPNSNIAVSIEEAAREILQPFLFGK